ncbi:MAG TPA: aspartyl protease family protein [Aridibacter sp.]|nr:aspartyl protease family protein [Aridibacter sp.]
MRLDPLTSRIFSRKLRLLRTVVSALVLMISISGSALAADDVQRIEPQETKKLLKQAKKLFRKGEIAEAEKILRRVIATNPQHAEAKLDLAYLLLKRKRLVDAYNYAFEVARADKDNAYAFAVLGAIYLSAGNFSDARTLLKNAIAIDDDEALAWAGLGMLDFYENRVNDSIYNLQRALQLDGKDADFAFALAQVSARAERYKESADAYQKYLRIAPDNDRERTERIKGLIRFLKYLGKRPSLYNLAGAKKTEVPVRLVNNRPVIQIRLKDGEEPLNFVLDTGSGISVISNETAERLRIKPVTKGGVARALGGDGKFDIVYGFLRKVSIGDVAVRNVPVYIRKFHNASEKVDGYIGLSLISKYITTIDYGKLTFSLTRKDDYLAPEEDPETMTVPLRLTSSGFLSGQVKLHGIEFPLNFIVDTGASLSVISEDLASSEELSGFIQDERMRVIGAAGITEDVPSFLLPSVTFGRFSRNDLKAIALDLDLINETSGFEQAGILGGNFLKNYRLTFDFKQSMVTFTPSEKD